VIIDQTYSIDFIGIHLRKTAITSGLQIVEASAIMESLSDQGICTLTTINPKSQVTQLVLMLIKLCNSFLIWYIGDCIDEFGS